MAIMSGAGFMNTGFYNPVLTERVPSQQSSGGTVTRSEGTTWGGGPSYSVSAPPPAYQVTAAPVATVQPATVSLQGVNPLVSAGMQQLGQQNLQADPYMEQLRLMTQGQFGPQDPSYAWRFGEGQRAVERSLAARGLLGSGNAAIELTQYGQGLASTEYGNQFSRLLQASGQYQNSLTGAMGRLASLAGIDLGQRQLNLGAQEFNAQQGLQAQEFNANYGLQAWQQQNALGLQASGQALQAWQQQNALGLQGWEAATRAALEQSRQEILKAQGQAQEMAQASEMGLRQQSYWDQQNAANQANLGASWARQTATNPYMPSYGTQAYSQMSGGNYSLGSANPSLGTPGWTGRASGNALTDQYWSNATSSQPIYSGGYGSFSDIPQTYEQAIAAQGGGAQGAFALSNDWSIL